MKRPPFALIFTLCLFTTFSAWAQLSGSSYADARRMGHGEIVYTYVTTPGFCKPNGQGKLEGLSVDIMDAFVAWLAQEKGITITTKVQSVGDPSNFSSFIEGVRTAKGGVFGLGNITITQERMKTYDFSPSIMPNVTVMLTQNSVTTLRQLEDLPRTFSGFTCYIVEGTTNAARMRRLAEQYYPGLNLVQVATSEESLQRVLQDPKGFTNLDFTYYVAILRDRMPLKRHPVGDDRTEQLGIIMPKGSDWTPVLTEFLESGFLESAEYRSIIARHLRRDVLALINAM